MSCAIGDVAARLEHVGDAAGGAQVAAVLGEDVADLGDGAVAVVGGALHQDGHAARAVTLEGDLLVGGPLQLARALLDGALDVVGGHVDALGLVHRRAQAGVGVGVAAADARRDGHLADDLGEDLAALGVERALLVLDRVPTWNVPTWTSPALTRRECYHAGSANEKAPTASRRTKRPRRCVGALRMKKKSRQRPTLPPGYPGSTIGAGGLNGRVRNGNGCDPSAMVTGMNLSRR